MLQVKSSLTFTGSQLYRLFHSSAVAQARNIKPWPVGLEGQWRKARAKKILKVELPDFEKIHDETRLTAEEYTSRLKEKGVAPPRRYKEKPISVTTMQGVLDPYVPPEGDGKFSVLSKAGAQQRALHIKQKGSSMLALRKIKAYEDDFDVPTFAEDALKIYIKAHELLAAGRQARVTPREDDDLLLQYVTEFAYPLMTYQTERRTIRWTYIGQIDRPEVIQMRTQSLIDKENLFAQITVRLNTRQILAVYDRFGHLLHGSEAVVKDVLEYAVFEKNISDYNGSWRLHSKIIPDWAPPKAPIRQTFIREAAPPPPSEEEIKFAEQGIVSSEKKGGKKEDGDGGDGGGTSAAKSLATN